MASWPAALAKYGDINGLNLEYTDAETVTISKDAEIARLTAEVQSLRESLASENAITATKIIEWFRYYFETQKELVNRQHDDDIEPFFYHIKMLVRDHVFNRLYDGVKGALPHGNAEAIKTVRSKIKSLQERFDALATNFVSGTRHQKIVRNNCGEMEAVGIDPKFWDENEFVLRLVEIAETMEYIIEITASMGTTLDTTEAFEIQHDLRRIVNQFITAVKSKDYVSIYDLSLYSMTELLQKVDSTMTTLAESA